MGLSNYLGDCQNYGPFLGPYYNTGPSTGPKLGDPKRDHNFDNPPFISRELPRRPLNFSPFKDFGRRQARVQGLGLGV